MKLYTIKNKYQTITLLNIGATIHEWYAFSDNTNIVISNEDLNDYSKHENGYLGNTIGRFANRIKDGKFILNNKEYQVNQNFHGNNHGHGGVDGFYKKEFEVLTHSDELIVFRYLSKDLEENYPGNLELFVTYELIDNKLIITYKAKSDQDTIVNITNHSYFNLCNEEETILNHKLYVPADYFLETDEDLIPTGNLIDLTNKNYDLRKNKVLKDVLFNEPDFIKTSGLDHTFVLNENEGIVLNFKNKSLTVKTSYPTAQIFSGNFVLENKLKNRKMVKHYGLAIEPQYEPDAINHKNFSNVVLKKDDTYLETIEYTIDEYNI